MLEDNESQKRKELEQGFNAKMKTVIDEQGPKKEVSYDKFPSAFNLLQNVCYGNSLTLTLLSQSASMHSFNLL